MKRTSGFCTHAPAQSSQSFSCYGSLFRWLAALFFVSICSLSFAQAPGYTLTLLNSTPAEGEPVRALLGWNFLGTCLPPSVDVTRSGADIVVLPSFVVQAGPTPPCVGQQNVNLGTYARGEYDVYLLDSNRPPRVLVGRLIVGASLSSVPTLGHVAVALLILALSWVGIRRVKFSSVGGVLLCGLLAGGGATLRLLANRMKTAATAMS